MVATPDLPAAVPAALTPAALGSGKDDAESVLRTLAPGCDPAVMFRLHRERVMTMEDLAGLDKEDLQDLGLTMVERSRVLRWARQVLPHPSSDTPGGTPMATRANTKGLSDFLPAMTPSMTSDAIREEIDAEGTFDGEEPDPVDHEPFKPTSPIGSSVAPPMQMALSRLQSGHTGPGIRMRRGSNVMLGEPCDIKESLDMKRHLLGVEQEADFWCQVSSQWTAKLAEKCKKALKQADLANVREDLLEALFDLNLDRVREVYDSMYESSEGNVITSHELSQGLRRCGLPELDEGALGQLLEKVVLLDASKCLQLAEFETILSRLVLGQLLTMVEEEQFDTTRLSTLSVVDYNDRCIEKSVNGREVARNGSQAHGTPRTVEARRRAELLKEMRSFFFGHRQTPQKDGATNLVRWVHMSGMDLTVLLALAVKYGLHPLAVEDVVQQSASKAERVGQHYFATIEGLCLAHRTPSDKMPVQVLGHHVSLFCAGPPILDTVLTIAQSDTNFFEEWPGGCHSNNKNNPDNYNMWVHKIRKRLEAPGSRLRERRGDFLIHATVDTCADELLLVVRAYAKRVGRVESALRNTGKPLSNSEVSEMSLARLQLGMVVQRARGMQRVVRRMVDDADLSASMADYLRDVGDHLMQAVEDAGRLAERCGAVCEGHSKAVEKLQERLRRQLADDTKEQEKRRAEQADSQNNILFFLTIVTTVFAPIQFVAGVYGMNFVNAQGTPTIPELLWRRGYFYFWGLVLIYLILSGLLAICVFRKRPMCPATVTETHYASVELPEHAPSSEGWTPGSSAIELQGCSTLPLLV